LLVNFVPDVLIREVDDALVVQASYGIVRVLRNKQRGYPELTVSTEFPPEARRLAEAALDEVCARFGAQIRQMTEVHVEESIRALTEFAAQRAKDQASPLLRESALSALKEMRSKS
jgi:hypothetical protein